MSVEDPSPLNANRILPYFRYSSSDWVRHPDFEMEILEAQSPGGALKRAIDLSVPGNRKKFRKTFMRICKILLFISLMMTLVTFVVWDKIPFFGALAIHYWNPEITTLYELGTQVRTFDRPQITQTIVFRGHTKEEFVYQVSADNWKPLKRQDPRKHVYRPGDLQIVGDLPLPSVDYMKNAARLSQPKIAPRLESGKFDGPQPIKLLSYDIDCRSTLFFTDWQHIRTMLWDEAYLDNFDVIGFQEQHEADLLTSDLKKFVRSKSWIYVPSRAARPGDTTPVLLSSGLVIVSKYKIFAKEFHVFHRAGYMGIQSSGVAFALVKTPGKHTFVFNTKLEEDIMVLKDLPIHLKWMMNTDADNIDEIRKMQLKEVYNFIRAMCGMYNFNRNHDRIVIMGNLNIDAINDEGSDPRIFDGMLQDVKNLFQELKIEIQTEPNRRPTFPIDDPSFISVERSWSHIIVGEYLHPLESVAIPNTEHLDFEIDKVKYSDQEMALNGIVLGKTISQHRGVVASISGRLGRP